MTKPDNSSDSEIEYDNHEVVPKVGKTWKRKRLDSEDYTSDESKNVALKVFMGLHNDNPTFDVHQLINLLKASSVVSELGKKWLTDEINIIIDRSRDRDSVRVSKILSELKTSLELNKLTSEEDDEAEDGDEDGSDEDDDEDEVRDEEMLCEFVGEMISSIITRYNKDVARGDEDDDDEEEEEESSLPTSRDGSKQTKPGDNTTKFKKMLSSMNSTVDNENGTMNFFNKLAKDKQKYYMDTLTSMKDKIKDKNSSDVPYLLRLMDFEIDDMSKHTILDHVSTYEQMRPGSSEYNKKRNLVKAIKNIPFGKSAKISPELADVLEEMKRTPKKMKLDRESSLVTYLKKTEKNLNKSIYGHVETKNQTMRLIASMISNGSAKGGHCFAMHGPPGVGKTQITEEIAKALGRPCIKINMGGNSNADDLLGHGYTYEGSTYGRIAKAIMDAGCDNPVLILDELDKVSKTARGDEVINVLIHLTDPVQNFAFQDKYLTGINIDLSKVIMVFSFNDRSNISPVLLDRMKIINVGGYKINDKVVIAKKYLIPSIEKELGFKREHIFSEHAIRDMINQFTFEGGVRRLKELITDILMEVNLRKLTGKHVGGEEVGSTINITKDVVRDDFFKDKHYIQHTMIPTEDQVGLVNGLWANSYGIGGLIPIEAHVVPSQSMFELHLTGMQGDVMKESMKVAKTVAWRLLPESRKQELMKQWKDNTPSGIHIHCPDGSTPKDGPSAGGAITTCLFSLLVGIPVKHSVAMTGEINLQGKISEIGGLEEKTFGAITAGVSTILYPKDNQRDVDKIRVKFPDIFDINTKGCIEMIPVSCIEEILELVLVK